MNRIPSILKDPLLHFLILGTCLFVAYSLTNDPVDTTAQRIIVDEHRYQALVDQFQRTWMRRPTDQELTGLVEDFVKEEVLYREALAMGLDRDDLVIRRRLSQKMAFINADRLELPTPTDADLMAYLAENEDRFRRPERYSFQQVYLNPPTIPDRGVRTVDTLLTQLNGESGSIADPRQVGDATLLPFQLDAVTGQTIADTFGPGFDREIKNAPLGRWSGPYASTFGVHLVRLLARASGDLPDLATIRPTLEREWTAEYRQEANQRFYLTLRARYAVDIHDPSETIGQRLAVREP